MMYHILWNPYVKIFGMNNRICNRWSYLLGKILYLNLLKDYEQTLIEFAFVVAQQCSQFFSNFLAHIANVRILQTLSGVHANTNSRI